MFRRVSGVKRCCCGWLAAVAEVLWGAAGVVVA